MVDDSTPTWTASCETLPMNLRQPLCDCQKKARQVVDEESSRGISLAAEEERIGAVG